MKTPQLLSSLKIGPLFGNKKTGKQRTSTGFFGKFLSSILRKSFKKNPIAAPIPVQRSMVEKKSISLTNSDNMGQFLTKLGKSHKTVGKQIAGQKEPVQDKEKIKILNKDPDAKLLYIIEHITSSEFKKLMGKTRRLEIRFSDQVSLEYDADNDRVPIKIKVSNKRVAKRISGLLTRFRKNVPENKQNMKPLPRIAIEIKGTEHDSEQKILSTAGKSELKSTARNSSSKTVSPLSELEASTVKRGEQSDVFPSFKAKKSGTDHAPAPEHRLQKDKPSLPHKVARLMRRGRWSRAKLESEQMSGRVKNLEIPADIRKGKVKSFTQGIARQNKVEANDKSFHTPQIQQTHEEAPLKKESPLQNLPRLKDLPVSETAPVKINMKGKRQENTHIEKKVGKERITLFSERIQPSETVKTAPENKVLAARPEMHTGHERIDPGHTHGKKEETIPKFNESKESEKQNDSAPVRFQTDGIRPKSPQIKETQSRAFVSRMSELIQNLEKVKKPGAEKSVFKLESSPLGKMEIQLKNGPDAKKIAITVESEHSKQEIQKLVPAIQHNLNMRGMEISVVTIDIGRFVQSKEQQAKQSSGRDKHKTYSKGKEGSDHEADIAPVKSRDFGYNTIEVVA